MFPALKLSHFSLNLNNLNDILSILSLSCNIYVFVRGCRMICPGFPFFTPRAEILRNTLLKKN